MSKCYYLCLCLLLAGCSDADWDHAMRYTGLDDAAQPEAAVSQPTTPPAMISTEAAVQPANTEFCHSVAAQDAARSGFDPATQARITAQSYAQCTALYTR